MQLLIKKLEKTYPKLKYLAGNQFYWSAETNEIFYKKTRSNTQDKWSLLHETGHALLNHHTYSSDYHLIKLERDAWDKALELAIKLDVDIDKNHVEDCLDTYREWLYKRSICPTCTTKCLQNNDLIHYQCFNCHTIWKVSNNRLCRSYRSSKNTNKENNLLHFVDQLK